MAYTLTVTFNFGTSKRGLVATGGYRLKNLDGSWNGARVAAVFVELGDGQYGANLNPIPDNFRGWAVGDTGGADPAFDSIALDPLLAEALKLLTEQAGSSTLTVTVETAGGAPVVGTLVTLKNVAENFTYKSVFTDEDGKALFHIGDGNYKLVFRSRWDYSDIAVTPVVMAGNTAVDVVSNLTPVTPPADPDRCTVRAAVVTTSGLPKAGVPFTFTNLATNIAETGGTTFVALDVQEESTNELGVMEQELIRSDRITTSPPGADKRWRIQCGALGIDRTETLNTAVLDLGVLIVTA